MFGLRLPTLGFIVLGIGALFGANAVENAQIERNTRRIVEAEAEKRTMEAINGVSDRAEQARVKRSYCASFGQLYNFETNECE